ncbi:MAG: GHKL domain-containing protein [Chitinophagales bacterium]|nr:GHKL domain-containing protein [Chitinophagales bacterium]
MNRRPLLIFYLLVGYIFVAFGWWIILLARITSQAYNEKKELTELNEKFIARPNSNHQTELASINQDQHRKIIMIFGEGSVFLIILLIVTWKTTKSLRHEVRVNRQQKNFLLSITHELRSPIASSKVALQTLLKHPNLAKEKYEILLNNSVQDMDRLQGLVENLLLATKIEDHTFEMGKDACDLSDITKSVVEKTKEAISQRRVFETNILPDVMVLGDRMGLTSVVTNLVENAVKYSPEGNLIRVSLSEENNRAQLTVADNGFGIPDSEKKKIFQKFYRVGHEETRKARGTGLGLYIVDRILALHQGKVSVKDNQPNGSVFEVSLPKAL